MTAKSLKAKSTRKVAKAAKPKEPGDGVSVLLREQRRLLHAMSVVKKNRKDEAAQGHERDAEWYGEIEWAAWDRASFAIDELSFMRPKTSEGAVFTLVTAYASLSDLASIQDAEFRERRRRRGIRLLYALLRYLVGGGHRGHERGDYPGDNLNRVIRYYMPPWDDPHDNLEGCRSFAVAGNSEGDGAAS